MHNPCGKCGVNSGKLITAHCSHCGHTRWVGIGAGLFAAVLSLLMGVGALASIGGVQPSDRATVIILGGLFTFVGSGALLFSVSSIRASRKWRRAVKSRPAGETEDPRPIPASTKTGKVLWGFEVSDRRTPAMIESDDEVRKELQDRFVGEGYEVAFFRSGEWPGSQVEIKSVEDVVLAYEAVLPFIQAHMKGAGLQMKEGVEPIHKGFNPNSFSVFYLFQVEPLAEPEEARRDPLPAPSPEPRPTEPALWAYMAKGPVVMAGSHSDEDLKEKTRKEFAVEGLTPVFFPPEDWDAPSIPSMETLTSKFPQIVERVQAHMASSGLPPIEQKKLVGTAEVRTNPATGTLIFIFRVQQPVKAEEEGPKGEPATARDFERTTEPDSPGECQFCGKTLSSGSDPTSVSTPVPGVEAVSISVSDDEDPFEAMQKAAERMLSSRLVCGTCGAVFCMECGGEEGQPAGAEEATCPTCSQAKPADPAQELLALSEKVRALSEEFPRAGGAVGAGADRAEKQIPWICRELGAASEALVSGRDPKGNPITRGQISGGLEQLVAYVRNPDYGTVMEMVYPGIDAPLQACMDQLESIVAGIEAA